MSNRSRRHSLRRFWISAMVLCVVVGLTAAISLALRPTTLPDGARSSTPNMPNSSLPSPDVSTLPDTPPAAATVRLMATGDNLIHDSIYQQANRAAGGNGFDFHSVYAHIEGLIAKADLAYLAQETIVAERLYPLSGYPRFNSPEAMGKHMVQIGFNVVGIANNHMFDMGEKGLVAALDFWQEQNVPVFGAWRTEADMHKPIITEKNGVKIAWVPMTEHTNGLALPADTAMRYLLTSERELIKEQIAQARQNADFVIVVPHWGTEYSLDANSNQIELAQCFADLGADLVLGGHSHTLQPMEWRMSASGRRTLVVYSLGNLVGSMLYPQNMLGGILDIDITKNAAGETSITRAELLPTVIQYEGLAAHLRVYPFSEYTDELAAAHGVAQLAAHYDVTVAKGQFTIEYLRGIIRKNIPKEFRSALPL